MASSHSRAFAVRGHHRARATFGFSTSPRCCQRRYKTASLKALANSERASNSGRTWALDFMRDFIILSFLLLLLVSLLKNFGFIIFFFFLSIDFRTLLFWTELFISKNDTLINSDDCWLFWYSSVKILVILFYLLLLHVNQKWLISLFLKTIVRIHFYFNSVIFNVKI